MFNIIKKILIILKKIRKHLADNATFYIKEELVAKKSLLGTMILPFLVGLPVPPVTALTLLPYMEEEIIFALERYSSNPDSFSFLSGLTDGVL